MKYNILIISFIVIIISGCTNRTKTIDSNNIINEYEYLKKELDNKEAELEHLRDIVNELKEDKSQTISEESDLFKTLNFKYLHGNAKIISDTKIRSIPSSNGNVIRSSTNEKVVYVYDMVKNKYGEIWVLIDYGNTDVIMSNAIGYVPENSLENLTYDSDTSKSIENIDGIKLNDSIDSAINKLGYEYLINPDPEGRYLIYCDITKLDKNKDILNTSEDILIEFYRNSRKIKSINLFVSGYCLESGYQVGDDVQEIVDYYKKLYPMEKNNNCYSFKLNDEEYLNIESSTTNENIVKTISLANYDIMNDY